MQKDAKKVKRQKRLDMIACVMQLLEAYSFEACPFDILLNYCNKEATHNRSFCTSIGNKKYEQYDSIHFGNIKCPYGQYELWAI